MDQISYEDVEAFCKAFPEGVRVEYKQDLIKNIPKVISSFANTVGGIWVIGVETDKATNLPKLPLVGRRAGIEEQIVQSAQSGIYPPVTPDVKVLDVPGKPDQMLAVVKVSESIEAPHAIEGSTRVYIRNASVRTRGH
jgi:predicted HTH transcriptional regulator